MRDLNVFESVFKRALRERFEYDTPEINKILLITDLPEHAIGEYRSKVENFLGPVLHKKATSLTAIGEKDFSNWSQLRAHLDAHQPDLVVSYRLLTVPDQEIRYSLGVYIDTLSQVSTYPVLILPNPHLHQFPLRLDEHGGVMVATEHLYTDHSLINYAARFTQDNAKLLLVHVEDEDTFEYYMKAIEQIPEIDTEVARKTLEAQLKADPGHYMDSVTEVLAEKRPGIQISCINRFGHMITTYTQLIHENEVDLLIFHTKDDTQLAMHSLGYSLAVEFKDIPVLLI